MVAVVSPWAISSQRYSNSAQDPDGPRYSCQKSRRVTIRSQNGIGDKAQLEQRPAKVREVVRRLLICLIMHSSVECRSVA